MGGHWSQLARDWQPSLDLDRANRSQSGPTGSAHLAACSLLEVESSVYVRLAVVSLGAVQLQWVEIAIQAP